MYKSNGENSDNEIEEFDEFLNEPYQITSQNYSSNSENMKFCFNPPGES